MFACVLGLAAAILAAAPAETAPAASPPLVEDYGKLPGMEYVTLSPAGDRFAFVARVGDQRRVVAGTFDHKILANAPIGKVKVVGLQWAGDDHLLATTSATVNLGYGFSLSKTELESVVVLNLAARTSFTVFDPRFGGRVANTVAGDYGAAQISGRWYGFFGAYTYDQTGHPLQDDDGLLYPELYRVDLDTGAYTLVGRGQSDLDDWLVGPDGKIAARGFYNEKNGAWRVTGDAKILLAGRDLAGGASILGFGKTVDTLLVETPGEKGEVEQEIPLAGGPAKDVIDDEAVSATLIDPINHLWIGVTEESDSQPAKMFDPVREHVIQAALKAFHGYVVHLVSYSADFKHLILKTEGGDDSGTYWFLDMSGPQGVANPIGMPYPSIGPAEVGPTRMIDYKAADGLVLHGVLTLPPGRKASNLPIVVMPHGGPVARDYPGFDYWAQAFASRGYAVFQPNFRGSSGYGAALRDAGNGQWGRKMQTDISDGLAELVKEGIADPKRACIVGWSYGGYAALAGVTVQRDLYRCAVSMAGVADPAGLLSYIDDKYGADTAAKRNEKVFLGVTSKWSYAQVNDISPVKLASRADAPILLIHGDNDTTVPIDQSQAMKRALDAAGKPVEFLTLPGADHWLLEEDARVAMLKASVAFVLKYDPPDPAPAAVAAK
jgi:dipeptidyl aminopeptidase/acylaminoacyl peptidase